MPSATAPTRRADPSIPDFTALGGRSSASASSWRVTSSAGTGSHPRTPTVFCAVTAVITLVPNTPNWWNVFRSAWMPAPPPESEPAMVRAIFGTRFLLAMSDNLASLVRTLQQRKGRKTRHLAVAEGLRLVEEALASGVAMRGVITADSFRDGGRGARLLRDLASHAVPIEEV